MNRASSLQIRRLQTLYSASISRELDSDGSRESRLEWASAAIGRAVTSFSELTSSEANTLIDSLQTELGQPETIPTAVWSRLRDRDRARAAGTEGRRKDNGAVSTLASQEDARRIDDAIERLGWTRDRFERWLASSSSPLRRSTAIRTLGDANRVWWALKTMLRREGKWTAPGRVFSRSRRGIKMTFM
jgi:hypothetical protein